MNLQISINLMGVFILRKSLCCLLVSVMIIFTSCGFININKLDFNKQEITLIEVENALGASFVMRKNMEVAELDGTSYAFEPDISLADRKACIKATDEVLDRISIDANISINIFSKKIK